MARFFLDPELWEDGPALRGDEAKHCARVMRAVPGDRIGVFDGLGRGAEAEIASVSKERVELRLGETTTEARPPVEIVLAQAVLKGKAMELVIQKSVELGVSSIRPLATAHSVVKPGEGKEDKWRRVVLEACKQCGRNRMPEVAAVVRLEDFLNDEPLGLRIIASLAAGARPLREVLEVLEVLEVPPADRRVTVLVGPEGDFSEEETAAALAAGWQAASFGATVLRSETAAIYGCAALHYALFAGKKSDVTCQEPTNL